MNRPQIEQWLLAIGSEAESSSVSDWVHGACPFAHWNHESGTDSNPSFGVQLGPGESKTYCLACGASGKQYDVMLKLKHLGLQFDFHTAAELVYAAEDGEPLVELPDPYEKQFDEKATPHLYPEWLAAALKDIPRPKTVFDCIDDRGKITDEGWGLLDLPNPHRGH